jgi:hypothetical protein
MRRTLSTAMAGLLTLVLTGPASPAHAAADTADTPCSAEITVDLDPGVSMTPSSGTFHSHGQDGSLTCTGAVDGRQPVAGGKGGADGKYGVEAPNSCYQLTGKAEFTLSATLPTEHGAIDFIDHVKGEYGPLEGSWFFGGSFRGPKSYGTFRFTPVNSDCVVRPVKTLFVQATAWIINGKPDAQMAERMSLR